MARLREGTIGWIDLTVDNAEEIRQFYETVAGWKSEPVSLGDYDDFSMKPPGVDEPVAGICHARGQNRDMPPQWMIYIVVPDLEQSILCCKELGGEILHRRDSESGQFAVIRDPGGAVAALYQAG